MLRINLLGLLVVLAACAAAARGADLVGTACTCASPSPPLQVIHNGDVDFEVSACEDGFYCDCANQTVTRCEYLLTQLDESTQQCTILEVQCEQYFAHDPTTSRGTAGTTEATVTTARATDSPPATPPTTAKPLPCHCDGGSTPPLQLIRGTSDAVQQCESGAYCDCQAEQVQHCEVSFSQFDEALQECTALDLDYCEQTLNNHPTTRQTVPETTPTASPVDEGDDCVCDPHGPASQLIRGDDQVAECEQGFYCDCSTAKVERCPMLSFDEDDQSCTYGFDCRAFFDKKRTSGPSLATSKASDATNKPSNATNKPSDATNKPSDATNKPSDATNKPSDATSRASPSWYAGSTLAVALVCFAMMCAFVNMGVIYTVQYCVVVNRFPYLARGARGLAAEAKSTEAQKSTVTLESWA